MMHSSESNSSLFYNDEESGSPLSPLTLSPSKRRASSKRLSLSLSECSLDHYDGDITGNHHLSSSLSSSSDEDEAAAAAAASSTMSPPPLWNNSYNKRLSSSFSSATLLTTATVDCSEHSEHSLGGGGAGDVDEEERLLLQSLQNEFQQEAEDIRWSATPQDSRCQHDAEIAAMMAAQFAAPAVTKPVVEQYKLEDTWCDRMFGLIVGLTLVIVFGMMGVVVSNDDEWGNNKNGVGDLYAYTCPTSWTELQRQLFVAPTNDEEEHEIFSNATIKKEDEACLKDLFALPMEEATMQTILGEEYIQYHNDNNNENNANLDTLQDKNVIFWGIPFQGMDDVLAEVPGSTYVGMSNERISTLRYRMNNPINNNENSINGDASSPENANEEQVWWITIGWNELQLLTQQQEQQEEEQAKRATTKSVEESNEEITSPEQSVDNDDNNYDTCSVQSSLHQMQLGILDLITSIQESTTDDNHNNNRNIKIVFHGIRNLNEELDVSFSDNDFNRAVATTEEGEDNNEASTASMTLNSLVQAWNQRLECITELGAQDESLPAMEYFQFQPPASSSSSSTENAEEEDDDDFFGDAMYTASKTTKDKDDSVAVEEVEILTRTEQIVAKIQQLQSN